MRLCCARRPPCLCLDRPARAKLGECELLGGAGPRPPAHSSFCFASGELVTGNTRPYPLRLQELSIKKALQMQ